MQVSDSQQERAWAQPAMCSMLQCHGWSSCSSRQRGALRSGTACYAFAVTRARGSASILGRCLALPTHSMTMRACSVERLPLQLCSIACRHGRAVFSASRSQLICAEASASSQRACSWCTGGGSSNMRSSQDGYGQAAYSSRRLRGGARQAATGQYGHQSVDDDEEVGAIRSRHQVYT